LQRFIEPRGGDGGVAIAQGDRSVQERVHKILHAAATADPLYHLTSIDDSLGRPPAGGSSQDHERDHLKRPVRLLLGQRGSGVADHGERIDRRVLPPGDRGADHLELSDIDLIGCQRPRPLRKRERRIQEAGGEGGLRGRDKPVCLAWSLLAEFRGALVRGRCGRVRATHNGLRARGFQFGGDRFISALGCQRPVPGAADWIVQYPGQGLVCGPPLAARSTPVGCRAHQRMTENNRAVDLHQPRVLSGLERGDRQAASHERRLERMQIAALLGRGEQQRTLGDGRQLRHPRSERLLDGTLRPERPRDWLSPF
jgi:hypothetical protein